MAKKLRKRESLWQQYRESDVFVKLSAGIMGLSHIKNGQILKGIGYFLLELAFVVYMIEKGASSLAGLLTLGTQQQGMVFDKAQGIYVRVDGDNSMMMLLSGVVALAVVICFWVVWRAQLASAADTAKRKREGRHVNTVVEDLKSLLDENIHKLLLFIPMVGLIGFTVLPLCYMILMAFTNYDVNHQPPGNLFTWIGLDNFRVLLASSSTLSHTFWPVLGWTLIWAFFATFTNYFLGMFLAMLINMKTIRWKKVWRTIFVLTIAVPSFVSLMVIRTMLNKFGVINVELQNLGFIAEAIPFLTTPLGARISVIVANMWIGIPFTMLITTGILTNIPGDLYESARIDGAGPIKMFQNITLPYILQITTPYLISNFIANFNNFNPIYFMTEGGPETLEYFKGAGKTDLLVTWLYKLTTDSMDYCYAAAIGILIFLISAGLSLLVYRRTKAYNSEEEWQT
ncbi:MAG: sugar ABC transporter permease [Faecalibacterium sp.]|jgi:arabinogalactan oligomer/maltooligosaccharide transport system permease protein|nr:sugar ABC transporter permease [Faecalibacterium sp.]